MSWEGPKVGQGMLDFVEDYCIGVIIWPLTFETQNYNFVFWSYSHDNVSCCHTFSVIFQR